MSLYTNIVDKTEKISVIGLGYVGLPLAVALAKKADVIAFDISKSKVETYKNGNDVTCEIGDEAIKKSTAFFTSDEKMIQQAKFHIVAVPTPIYQDKTPDLSPVEGASEIVGRNLTKGSIVVYESTVYPGVTEDICVPILEKVSGLKCGTDFKVGYSPERINPGDKVHRLESILKVVSGMDEESLDIIAKVYGMIIDAGVYKAASIKVAEAAKVIENSQRDINIAFMNELSIIFNMMGIDTKEVLEAAGTKWNFLNFTPGLVGGHCIGVDPYYLTYKAQMMGYSSKIILSGRMINDSMGKYVAEQTIKSMIKQGININKAKIAIFGITFKENCPDVRNTKVIDVIKELQEYGIEVIVVDPVADADEVKRAYGIALTDINEMKKVDCCIFCVGHNEFLDIDMNSFQKHYADSSNILIDVKGIFEKEKMIQQGYHYWRL
ncbi:MAG: nucleotide sugar dehydrogenase [Eubacteriales bacterium]